MKIFCAPHVFHKTMIFELNVRPVQDKISFADVT